MGSVEAVLTRYILLLFVSEIHEDRRTKLQSFGQADDILQRNIPLPTLNATKVTACQSTLQGELLLRPAPILAQHGKTSAEKKFGVR